MATQGTVKGLTIRQVEEVGATILLSNAYHLYMRGLHQKGDLHTLMGWSGPILTDSGGYQVFSLAKLRTLSDEGVEFQSHIDGTRHFFTPEEVVNIQVKLGSDIMMPLDECPPYPCERSVVEEAVKRTTLWAGRSRQSVISHQPAGELWGIIQGGVYPDLRKRSVEEIAILDFPGFGIGGLSVGEPTPALKEMAALTCQILPPEKPRHLLGVGSISEIEAAIDAGVDLFDCTLPTRLARHGHFLTLEGRVSIRLERFRDDNAPLDSTCDCYTCTHYSRLFLRHLFVAYEITALSLLTIHNLRFLLRWMEEKRRKIAS